MLVFPRRNSRQSLTNFWFSIRTINRKVKHGLNACLSCFPCWVSWFLFWVFPQALLSSPLVYGCWFPVAVFFAASWLNHRFYPLPCCAVTSNGSRSGPCFSSPPGSGHYASKPPGGASPFLRAIHWVGRFHAFFTFSLRPSDIKRPPHLCSFTSVVTFTNNGVTWGYPVTHGGKPWTKPSSYHYALSFLHGRRPYFYHTCGMSKSSSHDGSRPWSNSGHSINYWTWSWQTRATIPVPVRSKQRVSSTVDPQPKKRQKVTTIPETRVSMVTGGVHPGPLPSRGHFWRPQLRWLWLWRSIRSCFRSWSIQTSTTATVAIQHPTSPPPFLQAPPHSHWHQTQRHHHLPPSVSYSQIQLIHLAIHPSVHGPTQMIKSWSAWNRTQSPVLRGRRSGPDFIAIPRYVNWDGESWSKRLVSLTNTVAWTHPSSQRRRINQYHSHVNAEKVRHGSLSSLSC